MKIPRSAGPARLAPGSARVVRARVRTTFATNAEFGKRTLVGLAPFKHPCQEGAHRQRPGVDGVAQQGQAVRLFFHVPTVEPVDGQNGEDA